MMILMSTFTTATGKLAMLITSLINKEYIGIHVVLVFSVTILIIGYIIGL